MQMENLAQLTHSIPQAMEILGLSRAAVYHEINEGRLRTYRVGRRRFVSHDALRDFIRAREQEAQGPAAA